jgi:hypothetical protein
MTALLEYQRILAAAVHGGERAGARALFQGTPARRERGLNVYANNAMHALVSALAATFPAVQRILGAPAFTSVAVGYARSHPPARDALLLWYGASFPAFLESLEGSAAPHLPDLARLEYAWLEAYHAAEAEPLPAAHFAALTPEQLVAARLSPHPSVRLLRSSWAIDRIWRGDPGIAAGGDGPAKNGAGGRWLIVARPFAEVLVVAASPPIFACLGALCAGALFGDATGHLDQPGHLAELQALIAAGVFTAIAIRL